MASPLTPKQAHYLRFTELITAIEKALAKKQFTKAVLAYRQLEVVTRVLSGEAIAQGRQFVEEEKQKMLWRLNRADAFRKYREPKAPATVAAYTTLIVLFLAFSAFYVRNEITGFVVSSKQYTYTQPISWFLTGTGSSSWAPEYNGTLERLKLSGVIQGTGDVLISFTASNQTWAVYDSARQNEHQGTIARLSQGEPQSAQSLADSGVTFVYGYGDSASYDPENDGYAPLTGAIDFSVFGSAYPPDLNDENKCARWEVYSIELGVTTQICNGGSACCSFVALIPERDSWNNDLYVTYGKYGSTAHNIVSAQLIYVNTNVSSPAAGAISTPWLNVSANFVDPSVQLTDVCLASCLLPSLDIEYGTFAVNITGDAIVNITSVTYSLTQTTSENAPPVWATVPDVTIIQGEGYNMVLSDYVSDPEHQGLNYDFDEPDNFTMDIIGGVLVIIPDRSYIGDVNVSISATDGEFITSSNFSILVVSAANASNETTFLQRPIRIGEEPRWSKRVKTPKPVINITIDVEGSAQNISVKKYVNGVGIDVLDHKIKVRDKTSTVDITTFENEGIVSGDTLSEDIAAEIAAETQRILSGQSGNAMTGNAISEPTPKKSETTENKTSEKRDQEAKKRAIDENATVDIIVEDVADEIVVEYTTPAPYTIEEKRDDHNKIVKVVSDVHYFNVITYTSIPDSPAQAVHVYWLVNGSREEMPFTANDTNDITGADYIEWITPHLSNESFEVSITVLNLYSYPKENQNWTVLFNTTGAANLTITPVNSSFTEFLTDNTATVSELTYLSVYCGDVDWTSSAYVVTNSTLTPYSSLTLNDSVFGESLFYSNWTCANETGRFTTKVLIPGYAVLRFNFGNSSAWAYDPSGQAPTHSNPILNSSLGTNQTNENLTLYNQSTADNEGDAVINVYHWFRNNVLWPKFILTFDGNTTNDTFYEYAYRNYSYTVTGPTYYNSTGGYRGGALYFNATATTGIVDFRNTSNGPMFNWSQEVTVMAWAKTTDSVGTHFIVGRLNNQPGAWALVTNSKAASFLVYNRTGSAAGSKSVSSTNHVGAGEWHHLAGRYNGTHISVFVDGNETSSIPPDEGPYLTSNNHIRVGGTNSAFGWNGSLDEVYIFNESISREQIKAFATYGYGRIDIKQLVAGDTWIGEIFPTDGNDNGIPKNSTPLTIGPNLAPTQGTPILNTSFGGNVAAENLTAYNISTADNEGDQVDNFYNWYRNGSSVLPYQLEMESWGMKTNLTRNYADLEQTIQVNGALYLPSDGPFGRGSYSFDGVDDFMNYTGSLPYQNGSIEAYVKYNDSGTTIHQMIAWTGNSTSNGLGSDAEVHLWIRDNASSQHASLFIQAIPNTGSLCEVTSTALTEDTWYHIVGTYNTTGGNTTCSIYVNGLSYENETTAAINPSEWGNFTRIGMVPGSGTRFLKGELAYIRIWNVTLTPEQIGHLYNNRTSIFDASMLRHGEGWNVSITPNDGTQDGDTKTSSLVYLIPPTDPTPGFNLVSVANNSFYRLGEFNITLNATFTDDDNMQVRIFGGNATTINRDWLLYKNDSVPNNGLISYNFTAPVVNNNSAGLIGLWHFDNRSDYAENNSLAYDSHNGKFNLTCSRTECPNWTNPGKIGGSYYFNGSMHFNSSVNPQPAALNNASWVFWINLASLTGTQAIVSKGSAAAEQGWIIQYVGGSGFEFQQFSLAPRKADSGTGGITTNTWNHIAIVFNGSGSDNGAKVKIYFNGYNITPTFTSSILSTIASTSFPFRVGKGEEVSTYLNATLDELAIWNRSLDAQEVLNLYRLGEGRYYWKANVTDGSSGNESQIRMFEVGRELAPRILNYTINDSTIYTLESVEFNLTAYDFFNVSHMILSTNNSGSFANESAKIFTAGSIGPSTKLITITANPGNTTGWLFYVNDTHGYWNMTRNESYLVGGVTWGSTSITVGGAIQGGGQNYTNATFTSYLTNTNVNLSCMSGNCNIITSNYTTATYGNNAVASLWFTCATGTAGSYSATFKLNSTETQAARNTTVSCTVNTANTAPTISLDAPANLTLYPEWATNITLTTTINDGESDPVTIEIYASPTLLPKHDDLVYWDKFPAVGDTVQFNYTVPPYDPDIDTQVLYHFDNRSEFGEPQGNIVKDFSNQFNGTLTYDAGEGEVYFNPRGVIGRSLNLTYDGTTPNYVKVADATVFGLYSLRNATYSVWVKLSNKNIDNAIFSAVDFSGGAEPGDGFRIYASGASFVVDTPSEGVTATNVFEESKWIHVAATMQSNGTIKLYANGTLRSVGTISSISQATGAAKDMRIGESNIGAALVAFGGELDEFIIMNRTLNQEEIYNLTRAGAGLHYWYVNVSDASLETMSETSIINISDRVGFCEGGPIPIAGQNWNLTTTVVCTGQEMNLGAHTNLIIHGGNLTFKGGRLAVGGNVTILNSGNFTLFNSSMNVTTDFLVNTSSQFSARNGTATIWQNGNLSIKGYYLLQKDVLRMNGTGNGSIGITIEPGATMEIINDANVTNGEIVGAAYFFRVHNTSTFILTNSTVSEAGWMDGDGNRGLEVNTSQITINAARFHNNYAGLTVYSANKNLSGLNFTGNFISLDVVGVNNSFIDIRAINYSSVGVRINDDNHTFVRMNLTGQQNPSTTGVQFTDLAGNNFIRNSYINYHRFGIDDASSENNNFIIDSRINKSSSGSVSTGAGNFTLLNTTEDGGIAGGGLATQQWYFKVNVTANNVPVSSADVAIYNSTANSPAALIRNLSTNGNGLTSELNITQIDYVISFTYIQTPINVTVTAPGFFLQTVKVPIVQSYVLNVNLTVASAPAIVLNQVANNSNYRLNQFNITLNATIYDNVTDVASVRIFGGNASTINPDWLLYKNDSVANNTRAEYNFTAPVVSNNSAGLIGLWHFDNRSEYGENNSRIYDSSGHSFFGNCTGTTCANWTASGRIGGAYYFNGSTNFAAPVAGTQDSLTNATWAAWVKMDSITQTMYYVSKVNNSGGPPAGYYIGWSLSNGFIFTILATTARSVSTGLGSYETGVWYHVAVTYNGSGATSVDKVRIYINGNNQTGTSGGVLAANIQTNAVPIIIGSDDTGDYWNGTIDELAIWNRSLNAQEVLNLYRLGEGRYYWKVNATDGTLGNDSQIRMFEVGRELAPRWTNITINDTAIYENDYVFFNTTLYDFFNLSHAIFSSNHTGSFVNDSPVFLGVPSAVFNVTQQITATPGNRTGYIVYANDTHGYWNQTANASFLVGGLTWSLNTLNIGNAVQNAGQNYTNNTFTSYLTNTNVNLTCYAGCNVVTSNYTTATYGNNAVGSLWFTCDTSAVGSFVGRFNLSSSEFTAGTTLRVDCAILAPDYYPNGTNAITNDSAIYYGDSVMFNASWQDDRAMNYSILGINDTGTFVNGTARAIFGNLTVASFNKTVIAMPGNITGWLIYANDSSNQWNQTTLQTFTIGGVTWPNTAIAVGSATQNAGQNYTNTTFTSYLTNTNTNLTCISGNCNIVTSNYTTATYNNGNIGSLWFTCGTAQAGAFSATFKLNSSEFKGAANTTVSCTVNSPDYYPNGTNAITNDSAIYYGDSVMFNASWQDDRAMNYSILGINDTGTFVNGTARAIFGNLTVASFNKTVIATPGNTTGWLIYANDSANQWNQTTMQTFTVGGVTWANTAITVPTANQGKGQNYTNTTFTSYLTNTNTNLTCISGNCSHVLSNYTTATYLNTAVGSLWFTCDTSRNGTLSAVFKLNSTEYKGAANTTVTCVVQPDTFPSYTNYTTNDSAIYQNDYVTFNATWSDNDAMSAAIFSTNLTGVFVNSTPQSLSGANAVSTFTSFMYNNPGNQTGWIIYANDSANQWNQTPLTSLRMGGVTWPNTAVAVGSATQNAGQNYSNTSFTSYLTNTNTNLTCISGNCNIVTSNYTTATYGNNAIASLWFTCGTTTVGAFSATFKLNSSEFKGAANTTVSCTVNSPDYYPNGTNAITNDSAIYYSDSVMFNASWQDDRAMNYSILGINSTGTFVNSTARAIFGNLTVASFNQSIYAMPGNITGWLIYANDSNNQWNQTTLQTFTVGGVTWPNTAIAVGSATQNAGQNYTNTTFTSYLTNTNTNLTCISGNCNIVTSNYTTATYNNGNIGSLWFTCGTAQAGAFSATFKLNSSEFKGAANTTVSCTVNSPDYYPNGTNAITNDSAIYYGDSVMFNASWQDDRAMNYSILGINSTGTFVNSTARAIFGNLTVASFNKTVYADPGNSIGWYMYVNDSSNQWNQTPIASFSMGGAIFNQTIFNLGVVNDSGPPLVSNISVLSYLLNNNTNITCIAGNCAALWTNFTNTNLSEQSYIAPFTCNNPSVGSFTANFSITSLQSNYTHNLTASCTVTNGADTLPPTWSNNQTNATVNTRTGDSVQFNITWSDNILGNYTTFSYNQSGSGFVNLSHFPWTNGMVITVNLTITATRNQTFTWMWFANDTSNNWNYTNNWSFRVQNTPPPVVNLSLPANNTAITNRTPNFNWTPVTDADSDTILYELLIQREVCQSLESCSTSQINVTGLTHANYTLTNAQTLDVDSVYNWTVRSYDGYNFSGWSSKNNFTENSLVALSLPVSTVNFGSLSVSTAINTSADNPPPLKIQNDGNVIIDLTLYANISLWVRSYANLGTNYFQFMAGNSSEANSFNYSGIKTVRNWTNMTSYYQNVTQQLNWSDASDLAEIELLVLVPADEPPGSKSAGVVIQGGQ